MLVLTSVTMSNSSVSVTTSSVKKELNEIDISSTSTSTKELKHKEQHVTTTTPHLDNVLTKGLKPIDAEFSKSRHLPEQNGEYFVYSYLQLNDLNIFLESHSVLFMSIFTIGFIGVIVFYIWKKSNGRLSFSPSSYQYSVLNTRLMDPDDDSNDPLMNDIGMNEESDVNFLDISRYQYSDDDDVELLGVSLKENTHT